ncbi:uncharacterized protein LOC122016076 isoform X3 [Zingiber officinale]|uniref:uncharacterized protein LOC122016076 isoform X3 n=1 Tax=Zingiber officinale TaxID=94328 RepID=UPI001C4ABE8D|nr:uncharacterized protein LOC122016076 isoform X3 [Zingiber officinale]
MILIKTIKLYLLFLNSKFTGTSPLPSFLSPSSSILSFRSSFFRGSRHLVTEETRKAKPNAGTSLSRAAVSVSSHLSSRRHFPFPSSSIGQSMPSLRRHPPRSSLPQRHHLRPRPRRSPAGSSSPLQMVPDLRPRPRRVHPLQCALALRQSQRAGPGKADPSFRLQEESTHGRRRHQLAHQSLLQVRQHRRRGEGVRRDTVGQERFRSLIPSYIRDSSVAVIAYDVASMLP